MTRISPIAFAALAFTGLVSAETFTFPDDGGWYTLETFYTPEDGTEVVCETSLFEDTCEVEPGSYRLIGHSDISTVVVEEADFPEQVEFPEDVELPEETELPAEIEFPEDVEIPADIFDDTPDELPSTPDTDPFLPGAEDFQTLRDQVTSNDVFCDFPLLDGLEGVVTNSCAAQCEFEEQIAISVSCDATTDSDEPQLVPSNSFIDVFGATGSCSVAGTGLLVTTTLVCL